jgi:hypothetical protein
MSKFNTLVHIYWRYLGRLPIPVAGLSSGQGQELSFAHAGQPRPDLPYFYLPVPVPRSPPKYIVITG